MKHPRRWRSILRKRHWFDQGESVSPRYFRNEPVITEVEIVPRLNHFRPIPRWLRREWEYVTNTGWIDADEIGIRDVVWPVNSGHTHPAFREERS